ncbi:UbiA prenyltransferase family protein [Algoriphagus vanfongensis]|uniref:UbiA prenyltransferase family protein n=1 Tax=Algoriphagus vanfongensis TaxID=426371 RepID=UPI00040CF98D|nr:UbiA prenyltransferase family protein [Algoriphagus vanfongensis]
MFLKAVFRLLRPKHWAKNVFVFFPLLFSGSIVSSFTWDLLLLFIAFCFAASSIYVVNDLVDVEKDRMHPEKRFRPIASGEVSPSQAIGVFLCLLLIIGTLGFFLQMSAFVYVISYFSLNLLYSFYLKNLSIVDVTCISLGFVFRVMAGGAESDIYVTNWMVILVFLLTIALAFSKRRDDFKIGVDQTKLRVSNTGYSLVFLDIAKSISFSITLVAYILYSIDPITIASMGSDKLYLTSFFVFLGIMRYIQISVVDQDAGSPVKVLYQDRFIQMTILGWVLTIGVILYG